MGCISSSSVTETKSMISFLSSKVSLKSDLLFEINSLKISQSLSSIYPELRLISESDSNIQIISQKVLELISSIEKLKSISKSKSPDYSKSIESLETLNYDSSFTDKIQAEIDYYISLIRSSNTKLRENNRVFSEMEQKNLTMEDLDERRALLEANNKELSERLSELKSKIIEQKEYLDSRKRRKRRFTVMQLAPNRMKLRSKLLMKQELIKKIEEFNNEREEKLQAERLTNKESLTPRVASQGNGGIREFRRFGTVMPKRTSAILRYNNDSRASSENPK